MGHAQGESDDYAVDKPAGVFLSNGPGDPAALGYAVQAVGDLARTGVPIFGICLGHQILAQALGGRTFKLKFGHRGANQPVKDLETGKVEITSQNHGFAVDAATLPAAVTVNRINLNDRTVEVQTNPSGPTASPAYRSVTTYGSGEEVPVTVDGREVGRVAAAELLP